MTNKLIFSELKRHLRSAHLDVYKKVVFSDKKALRLKQDSFNDLNRKDQKIIDVKEKYARELKELKSGRDAKQSANEDEDPLENVDTNAEYDDDDYDFLVDNDVKDRKLIRSSVHTEFLQTKQNKSGKICWSSICNHCEYTIPHKQCR